MMFILQLPELMLYMCIFVEFYIDRFCCIGIDICSDTIRCAYAFKSEPQKCFMDKESWFDPSCSLILDENKKIVKYGKDADELMFDQTSTYNSGYYVFKRYPQIFFQTTEFAVDLMIRDENGKPMKAGELFETVINYHKHRCEKTVWFLHKDLYYVVTIPSVSGDQGKTFMRSVLDKCGFLTDQACVHLAHEVTPYYKDQDGNCVDNGMFMDISFEDCRTGCISVLTKHDDHTVNEIVPVSAGPWGSLFIADSILSLIESICGINTVSCNQFELHHLLKYISSKLQQRDDNSQVTVKLPVDMVEICRNSAKFKSEYMSHVHLVGDRLRMKSDIWDNAMLPLIEEFLKYIDQLLDDPKVRPVTCIVVHGEPASYPVVKQMLESKYAENRKLLVCKEEFFVVKAAILHGFNNKRNSLCS